MTKTYYRREGSADKWHLLGVDGFDGYLGTCNAKCGRFLDEDYVETRTDPPAFNVCRKCEPATPEDATQT